jgi:alkanesulfonate monooxygenase SsuD/methylene tetrahydromethanopterin reductase-like flavin-dependent oxidoreductase (luciferase family)
MPTPQSTARTLQDTARAAADQGYSILLAPDSMFLLSPLPSLAIAASAADIRIGTFVLSPALRAPAVSALEASGIAVEAPAQRIRRIEEIIDRISTLNKGGRIHVTMAAGGPKARAVAARVADSVILTGDPYQDAAGHSGLVDEFQQGADERAEHIELLTNLLVVGNGPVDASTIRARGLDPDRLLSANATSVLRGSVDEMCDELLRRRELLGTSYITISEPVMEQFAPVVERLSGK